MVQKLKAKGFTYDAKLDCLEGEFNGRMVKLHIVTNNRKVWRIVIEDAYPTRNEADIRIRFNTLCRQFSKNRKYIPADQVGDFEIDENEDISGQILLYNKRYEAGYLQITEDEKKTISTNKENFEKFKRGQEQLQKKYDENGENSISETALEQVKKDIDNTLSDMQTTLSIWEAISNRSVWFMIAEQYGRYSIIMYYDNEYNHSDGEDL